MEASSLGLGAAPLDVTGLPGSAEQSARDEAGDDDYRKARIHAALFDGRPLPPEHLGRFVLRDTLGRGGMGTVFEAYDTTLDRKLALKVLHPTLDERHARRLVREAQALAKLSHPNVVHVYEVGEVEGRTFIAMELAHGSTLRKWQEQSPRPDWRACVEAYLQAGQGLAAAHAAGLVHRDFKPGNCIIGEDGRVRVLDFGLVRELEGAADEDRAAPERRAGDERLVETMTRTGAVLGTVAYMPLEQLDGGAVDARGDQFSFCVSLYEALYGERPFEGEAVDPLRDALAKGSIRPAPAGTRVPNKLRSVLLRGLSADPSERWPSMTALLEALRHVVAPRIQVVSKVVKLVAVALFWVSLVVGAAGIAAFVRSYDSEALAQGDIRLVTAYSTIMTFVIAGMLLQISRLAALFERGQLFSAASVRHLRTTGILVTLVSFGPGLRPDLTAELSFHPTPAVAGLLFVFISWVMDEARQREQRRAR